MASSRQGRLSVRATFGHPRQGSRGSHLVASVAALALAFGGLALAPRPAAAAWAASLGINFTGFDIFGDGSGRVTSDDGGIDCSQSPGGGASGDCSQSYTLPSYVTSVDVLLTLNPSTGSYACENGATVCSTGGETRQLSIHLTTTSPNATAYPEFFLRSFYVAVDIQGPGTISGNGASCTPPGGTDWCNLFKYGQQAVLIPAPFAGYPFNGWDSEPCAGTTTCSFTVTGLKTLAVLFGRYNITVHKSDGGRLCLPAYATVCVGPDTGSAVRTSDLKGTSITAVATPASGWAFASWSSGPCSGKPATCTFSLAGDTDLTANFLRLSTPAPSPKPTPAPTPKPTPRPTAGPGSPSPTSVPAPTSATSATAATAAPASNATADPQATGIDAPASGAAPSEVAVTATSASSAIPSEIPSSVPAELAAPVTGTGPSLPALIALFGLALLLALMVGIALGRRRTPRATDSRTI